MSLMCHIKNILAREHRCATAVASFRIDIMFYEEAILRNVPSKECVKKQSNETGSNKN